MSDFNHRVLDERAHRPWPMPDGPWVMTQTWHNLLFAHWPVDVRAVRDLVPGALPLDRHEGQAWLGIVPFRMTNVAPRGLPNIPFVSAFAELNVRTYVTVSGKPGVYFFSLDAASRVAVAAARLLFGLPYFAADMQVEVRGRDVRYTSRRTGNHGRAEFVARYRPTGPAQPAAPGTLEWFLTERYCLYRVDGSERVYRVDIHHPPWPLQPADAVFERNSMAEAAGLALPDVRPLCHYAHRQDTVAWAPQRIGW